MRFARVQRSVPEKKVTFAGVQKPVPEKKVSFASVQKSVLRIRSGFCNRTKIEFENRRRYLKLQNADT